MRTARLVCTVAAAVTTLGLFTAPVASAAPESTSAVPIPQEQALCDELFGGVFEPPSSEPLAQCQWDMALIDADEETWERATGDGVLVGVIDSGVDLDHPDIVPNLNLAL